MEASLILFEKLVLCVRAPVFSHEQLFCGLWGMEGATPPINMVHFLKAANLFFSYRVLPIMDKVNRV